MSEPHNTPPGRNDRRAFLRLACAGSAALALPALTASCGGGSDDSDDTGEPATLRTETFAEGLQRAWAMAFLPGGGMLVTERAGRLRPVAADGELHSALTSGVPDVDDRSHGGLLDIALDPGFSDNRVLYLSYTEPGTGPNADRNAVAVMRARINESLTALNDTEVIYRQQRYWSSRRHPGGRIALTDDGFLFLCLGDRFDKENRTQAQDLDSDLGKIIRIRTDGSVPSDNPFRGTAGARPEIWSLGHRNVQGAFVHPTTGALWASEHGPQGGDEINIIQPGLNYGWPLTSQGCEYETCDPIGDGNEPPGLEEPLLFWEQPSIAPTQLFLYSGQELPGWRGHLFVATLAGRALWRVRLGAMSNGRPAIVDREPLFESLNERMRDARQGPDGFVYLLTDGNPARIIRVRV